jgi:hypothetical protein
MSSFTANNYMQIKKNINPKNTRGGAEIDFDEKGSATPTACTA